jgi:hypothetical protein
MSAVDRVMRAFLRTRTLTADQHQQVRFEIARMVDELGRDATQPADRPGRLVGPSLDPTDQT